MAVRPEGANHQWRRVPLLDPNLADGYCGLVMVQIYAAAGFGTGDLADALGSIGPLARQAVSLDANNAVARSCVGFALFARGDYIRTANGASAREPMREDHTNVPNERG
jgi:cytochrome c-type biogenesis protein CcmH/NrfG